MKAKLTNNLTFKLLSVFFAVVLWLLVMNLEDPDKTVTIRNVAVTILNEEAITGDNQVYEIKSGDTCDIIVTGPRSIVDSLTADDFVAKVDFTEISQTNAIPIVVSLSEENQKYQNRLNITQQTHTMRISVEKVISKEYEIKLQYDGKLSQNYVMNNPVMSYETVTITASESIISSIEEVRAIIDISNVSEDLDKDVTLTLYNASGKELKYTDKDIDLNVEKVNVKIKIYTVKEIPVVYIINEGSYGNFVVNGTVIDKATIKVCGTKASVATINELKIPEELLEFEDMSENNTFTIAVKDILPEGIYVCNGYEEVVISVDISNVETKLFNISLSDVMIKKIPEGYEASIEGTGNVTVRIRGAEELVAGITAESLLPYVDLTGLTAGENTVNMRLTLPNGVVQLDEVAITVNINSKSEETTEENTTDGGVE